MDKLKSNINGCIAELKFAQAAMGLGWQVSKPLLDVYGYDYVVCIDSVWYTVQVKQARISEKRPGYFYKVCDFTYGRHKKDKCELFDYLAIVDDENIWFIPSSEIPGSRYISLTAKFVHYKL